MCTLEKRGRVYLLTLTGDGEHRLNTSLLSDVRSALARVRSDPAASALVTAAEGRFFSNGFDLAWAKVSPSDRPFLMGAAFRSTVADLLSLPVPTVAAVTGHATAAGCALALAHDYIVMRGDRGFLYMSELDIGLKLVDYFLALVRAKVSDPRALRDVLLRSEKLTGAEAAKRGIVDRVTGGPAEAVEEAVAMAEGLAGRNWNGEVYAAIRMAAMPELCRVVGLATAGDGYGDGDGNGKEERKGLSSKL